MFNKVGFERELFVREIDIPESHGPFVHLYGKGFPTDGNPWLLECRGKAQCTALEAKYSLLYVQAVEAQKLQKLGFQWDDTVDAILLDRHERAELRRIERKEPMKQFRIGGGIRLPHSGVVTAGLHVHFSWESTSRQFYDRCDSGNGIHYRSVDQVSYYPLNIPRIVYLLDTEFRSVIEDADRQTGLYEMKHPYGFEYRSLPTTVNLDRLVAVLDTIQKEIS
jgi:hypothetical protein